MFERGVLKVEIARHFGVSPSYITKRLRELQPPELPGSFEGLSEHQQKFVLARVEGKTQTQAALGSYECGSMESAKVMGSQLGARPDIKLAIQDIMAEEGLTRRKRVQKLKDHVFSKREDISLKALDQSWKLDGSYSPQQIEVWQRKDFDAADLEAKELKVRLRELEAELGIDSGEEPLDAEFSAVEDE